MVDLTHVLAILIGALPALIYARHVEKAHPPQKIPDSRASHEAGSTTHNSIE